MKLSDLILELHNDLKANGDNDVYIAIKADGANRVALTVDGIQPMKLLTSNGKKLSITQIYSEMTFKVPVA